MELKLVYRALRKASRWMIGGWYSDVFIDGAVNVPKKGPLILVTTHHNEIVDIATLVATIPHGRPICFWTKSTLFGNVVTKFILESIDAIRVERDSNRVAASSTEERSGSDGANTDTGNDAAEIGNDTIDLGENNTDAGNNNDNVVNDTETDNNNDDTDADVNNTDSGNNNTPPSDTDPPTTKPNLFKSTSRALAQGKVIGIFPEGTSYTLPAIAQVLPGAAWAAVEYVKSVREDKLARMESDRAREVYIYGEGRKGERTGLKVVPVGIVYEDKARYRSRVRVGFGEPIRVDAYTAELFNGGLIDLNEAARSVVNELNAEIERRLIGLTVNAPDWETLYAARMAMKILWKDQRNVRIENWVGVSQNLVNIFSLTEPDRKLDQVRKSLLRYYSLLYYSQVDHTILSELLPLACPSSSPNNLSFLYLFRAFCNIASSLPLALICFFAFVPVFLFHIPAYIVSQVMVRALRWPGHEETEAEYRAIGGGIGIGLSIVGILAKLWRTGVLAESGFLDSVKGTFGLFVAVYASVYVLVKWHLSLVQRNLRQLRRLTTFGKLVRGALFSGKLRPQELQMYSTPPPPPPVNTFIRGSGTNAVTAKPPPPISSRKLIRELLNARLQAYINLGNYLRNLDSKEMTYVLSQGARVPSVVS